MESLARLFVVIVLSAFAAGFLFGFLTGYYTGKK